MESSSPVPSPPPARGMQAARISSFPPRRRSSRPPIGVRAPTVEMPQTRRPPIPQSDLDRDLRFISRFVSEMKPGLSAEDAKKFDSAAEAAGKVTSISPVTEFMARLDIGFVLTAQRAYERFKADPEGKLVQ